MTAKRFQEMVDSDMQVIGFFDDVTDEHYFSFEEVVDKLNELHKENEQLRELLENGLEVSQVEIDEELERMNSRSLKSRLGLVKELEE